MKIEHVSRWISASLFQHFNSKKRNYSMLFEGIDPTKPSEDSFEFRITGPHFVFVSRKLTYVDIDINILIRAMKDHQSVFKNEEMIGIMAEACVSSIPVYKYGDGPDDDPNTLVFCLERQAVIEVTRFGLIQATNNMNYSTIECRYRAAVSEGIT